MSPLYTPSPVHAGIAATGWRAAAVLYRASPSLWTWVTLLVLTLAAVLPAQAQHAPGLDRVEVVSPEVLARNKRNVIEFYDLALNQGKPREAIERYAGATYTQHNPEVPDGKNGFIGAFEKMVRDYPNRKLVIKRVFAEGHHVIVHCWSEFPSWFGRGEFAGIDIFRLDDNGKIVEHWDVLQRIPRSAANANSMF